MMNHKVMILARSRRGLGLERNVTLSKLSFFRTIFPQIISMRDLIKITSKDGSPAHNLRKVSYPELAVSRSRR